MSSKIAKIKKLLANHENDSRMHTEMSEFLARSEKEVNRLLKIIEKNLESIRIEIAEFLCEDIKQFKLEECFRIFFSFCQRFKIAVDENVKRKETESKLEARRSNSLLRRSWNSTNSDNDNLLPDSPLVTPNGTLEPKLRGRSGRSSKTEDELHNGLLEFLKTASELGTNDTLLGGSFRRTGSGRRSRLSNPFLELDEGSRERNESASRSRESSREKSDERIIIRKNSLSSNLGSSLNSSNLLSEGHSDDENDGGKRNFNRFSPLRRTFNVKPFERKPVNQKQEHDKVSDVDGKDLKDEHDAEVRCNTERAVLKFWTEKDVNDNNIHFQPGARAVNLSLNQHHHSQQPTAVITPTKVEVLENQKQATASCIPQTTTLPSRLPVRTVTPQTSVVSLIPIVKVQARIYQPPKSKVPVRKNSFTRPPQQRKSEEINPNNSGNIHVPSSIPKLSLPPRQAWTRINESKTSSFRRGSDIRNSNRSVQQSNVLTKPRSATVPENKPPPIPAPRRRLTQVGDSCTLNFMKQTFASAAKTEKLKTPLVK